MEMKQTLFIKICFSSTRYISIIFCYFEYEPHIPGHYHPAFQKFKSNQDYFFYILFEIIHLFLLKYIFVYCMVYEMLVKKPHNLISKKK